MTVTVDRYSRGDAVVWGENAACRAIELSLQRSDHAAQCLGGSNQHRIVSCFTRAGGKQSSLLGHSKLLPRARCPRAEMEQRAGQRPDSPLIRSIVGEAMPSAL